MKIRITQSGYEAFCGLLGDVKFENGVSVGEASEQQVAYVAAMFITETFEDEVTSSEQTDAEGSSEGDESTSQGQEAVDLEAEAARLAAEAARERAEAEAAEAAAEAAEAAATQAKQVAK